MIIENFWFRKKGSFHLFFQIPHSTLRSKVLNWLTCLQWRRLCVQAGFLQQLIRGTGHSARKYCLLQGRCLLFVFTSYDQSIFSLYRFFPPRFFSFMGPHYIYDIFTFFLLWDFFTFQYIVLLTIQIVVIGCTGFKLFAIHLDQSSPKGPSVNLIISCI
jgi:hypothetical protein